MTRLYGRSVRIVAGGFEYLGEGENALQVRFRARRDLDGKTPDKCDLQIYGLAEHSRSMIERAAKDKQEVVLEAGYIAKRGEIFRGDISRALSRKEPTCWVTSIQSGDGAMFREGRVSVKAPSGASVDEIVKRIIRQMRGPNNKSIAASVVDTIAARVKELGFKKGLMSFVNGYSAQGQAGELLDEITKALGAEWNVVNGEVQLFEKGGFVGPETVVLKPTTGLIDAPELEHDEQNPGRKLIRGTSLLQAEIVPARKIEIQSETVTGLYRCIEVEHEGDNKAREWYSRFKAEAVA